MEDILLYLWQLPQNILGWLVLRCFRTRMKEIPSVNCGDCTVHYVDSSWAGCSLGRYIFLRKDLRYSDPLAISHEYGHCLQSIMLGWLYLPTVGLVSGLRNALGLYRKGRYYEGWPEKWADDLGGIRRDENGRRYR